eukprot:scaffold22.g6122.t1
MRLSRPSRPLQRAAPFISSAAITRTAAGVCLGSRAHLMARLRAASSQQHLAEAAPPHLGAAQEAAAASGGGAPDAGAPPRRRRGRPPGIPAWNKGLPVPDSVRTKISQGQVATWRDADVRRRRTEAMKGLPSWNTGLALPEDVRARMAAAHLGKRHTKAARQRISKALSGLERGPEFGAVMSARLAGQPKAPEHRARIAAAQRRRHAAARVLQAVEAVYQRAGEEGGSAAAAGGPGPGRPRLGGLRVGPRQTQEQQQAIAAFKAQLREYRALQEELSPWTRAFVNKHGRKPALVDVQRTGIAWLIGKYKEYVLLRDRLFNDTSLLRARLAGVVQDVEGSAEQDVPSAAASGTVLNANGPTPAARSAAASRVAAALQYKQQREEREQRQRVAAATAAAAADPLASAPSLGAPVPAAAGAAGLGGLRSQQGQAGQDEAAPPPHTPRALPALGRQVPSRVRLAMQAAMEYRSKKAKATKAVADAAAAAAEAGWHDAQLSTVLPSAATGAGARPGPGAAGAPAASNGAVPAGGALAGSLPASAGRRAPGCLPAEVALAQVVAHKAVQEAAAAEAEVRKALELPADPGPDSEFDGLGSLEGLESLPAAAAAGAAAAPPAAVPALGSG